VVDAARSRAQRDATIMYAGIGAGGAALLSSLLLFSIDPAKPRKAALDSIDRQIEALKK
jgi:hypothetical protein